MQYRLDFPERLTLKKSFAVIFSIVLRIFIWTPCGLYTVLSVQVVMSIFVYREYTMKIGKDFSDIQCSVRTVYTLAYISTVLDVINKVILHNIKILVMFVFIS